MNIIDLYAQGLELWELLKSLNY